jgi:NADH dehydrogenase FAD-containing subunit
MKVVLIGGGIAGLATGKHLRKLDKNLEIILIEPKEYMEVHWCGVRSLFDEEIARKSTFSINKWAIGKSIVHIQDRVTQLSDTEILLSDGQYIEFNICVICSGAATPFAAFGRGPPNPRGKGQGRLPHRLGQMQHWGKRLLESQSVAIIGGGLVGVELAGDLAFFAKQQSKQLQIALIHNQERLVPEFTPGASDMAFDKLTDLGVEVILNEKAVPQEDGNVRLNKSGDYLQVNEIIWTTGNKACNGFLDRKYLNKQGWILVDEHFQVKGSEGRLFAMGDCCDLLPNTGSQAMEASYVLAKNVKIAADAMKKGDEPRLKRALVSSEIYVATIGKTDGVALTPICHTQFMLPWLKNMTFFLWKVKSRLGLNE